MDNYNLPRQLLICKKLRLRSNHRKKMSSVITKHGKLVSFGWNIQKSHPKYADGKKSYSLHAEINAIIRNNTNAFGATIYVYREINGIPAMAKPCNNCLAAIIESGIKKIVYSVSYYPYYEEINL
jgi:deoxycytidylate deaminase